MGNFAQLDYFTDQSIINDPAPYFDYLRNQSPICRLPHRNVMAVTGLDEAVTIMNDSKNFSSVNAVTGPMPELPFPLVGPDLTQTVEENRAQVLTSGMIVTMDGALHAKTRALLMRLFTPSRLKAVEDQLTRFADGLIDEFVGHGQCEVISQYGSPYAMLVIATLLGIPEADQVLFREKLVATPAQFGEEDPNQKAIEQFTFLLTYFQEYITDRRANPKDDVLTELATSLFPDGTQPEVMDVVWVAAFLFGAGQDTTARVLSAGLRFLGEMPELQARLRKDPSLVPKFVEEVLRLEGPVKVASRLALRDTQVGGVDIPVGTTVCIFNWAINRDPRRFDHPHEFQLDRPRVREHVAFGRGAHSCAGAPLARTEVRVSIERILDRLGDIRINEAKHGSGPARKYDYEATYLLRGLTEIHVDFTDLKGATSRSA